MMTPSETLNTLLEMGFSEPIVKLALAETENSGLEAAVDWIMNNSSTYKDDEEIASKSSSQILTKDEKNDDKDEEEIALKSSSQILTEDEKFLSSSSKEMTEEERNEQILKLEALRVIKRQEREEKEKAEALEREKRRIKEGKELSGIRKDAEDKELRFLAEERRREKRETEIAKERVRAQIKEDKEARKRSQNSQKDEKKEGISTIFPTLVSCKTSESDTALLQIRLPDGSTLRQSFGAKEPLSAVRHFVSMNRKDSTTPSSSPCIFMTNFPKKVFEENEMKTSLDVLGLVPSATLIVK